MNDFRIEIICRRLIGLTQQEIQGRIFHFLQAYWYRFLVDAKIYEAKKHGIDLSEKVNKALE